MMWKTKDAPNRREQTERSEYVFFIIIYECCSMSCAMSFNVHLETKNQNA